MQEYVRIEENKKSEEQKSIVPLRFVSGGIWRKGKEYFLERRNYNHYLLLYTMGGEGYLSYDGLEYQLLPGTAFLIDCSKFQSYRTAGEVWEFAFVHFDTECMIEYVEELYHPGGVVFEIADGKQMESRMREVITLFQGYHRAAAHQAFGLLAQLLGMLYAASEHSNTDRQIGEDTGRVIRIIEERYPEKLTLDSLARETGHSKYYLAHQFKADMGIAVYGYLTLYRISKSKLLLQNTNLSVAEIAEQVGFTGVSNFIRTFSEYEGITPHQYRKQWQ